MKRGEIKAIIFDVGGVLQVGGYSKKPYKNHRTLGVHNFIAKRLKIPLDQYFDSIDTTYAKSIEGKISEKQTLETIAKNLKISVKKLKKLLIAAYRKNFRLNKELFKQALKLKKKGYKIAILSDQWHLSRDALITSKLKNNFSPAIISCNAGMRKPNPKIYRLILKKLRIKPSEAIFIDDHNWNIQAAKKLGMKTILFKNNKHLFKQLEKLGVKVK